MIKLFCLALLLTNTTAWATCFGSDNFKTCSDDLNGNQYTINKFGGTTTVDGYNSHTGNSWNESTQTIGNSTYINGQAANGETWNETISNFGSMKMINGTDSSGQSFSITCTQFGCY